MNILSRALHGRTTRRCGESEEIIALPSPQCAATNFVRRRAPRRSVDDLPLLRDMAAFHLKRSPGLPKLGGGAALEAGPPAPPVERDWNDGMWPSRFGSSP
eukprot:6633563-Prymnesium_polylepis.2